MTCQHCQTWILDEEHRCHRCGRRIRTSPHRVPSSSFPVAATATALDYSRFPEEERIQVGAQIVLTEDEPQLNTEEQGSLFTHSLADSRVIPFDSLTTREERQSIRARLAGLEQTSPTKTDRIETRPTRRSRQRDTRQRNFDYSAIEDQVFRPKANGTCHSEVAPIALRLQAALVDLFVMVIPAVVSIAIFFYAGGEISADKHTLPYFLLALATIPMLYKLLWAIAGSETIGMRSAGLLLVDFDGNPPSPICRYLRCFGACLSFLAGGIGMVWSLVDEDHLTWHDHISSTHPTVDTLD